MPNSIKSSINDSKIRTDSGKIYQDIPQKSADVLLVSCPWGVNDEEKREHLGLGYLSSFLSSHGFSVKIIDANFFQLNIPQIISEIETVKSPVVGFSVMRTNLAVTLEVSRLLRNRGMASYMVMGGPEATLSYANILSGNHRIDCVVLGEGEYALLELVQRLNKGEQWQHIPGIAYPGPSGSIKCNETRYTINHLDSLPFPDRSLYENSMSRSKTANVYSSRGCYGNCSFCGIKVIYKSDWRGRSAKNVVDEIEMLVRKLDIKTIEFSDDNFMGPGQTGKQRAYQIGQELLSRKIKVNYSFQCRPNDIDENLMGFLKTSGLYQVCIGVESWIPRQLKMYRKGLVPEQIDKSIVALNKSGLNYSIYLIFFDPYVNVEELISNLDIIERVGLEHISIDRLFTRLRVNKSFPLYKTFIQDGIVKETGDSLSVADAVYTFQDRIVEIAYRFGEKIIILTHRKFLPLFVDPYLKDNLAAQFFLQSVDMALKRLLVKRYRQILERLRDRDEDGAENLAAIVLSEFEQQINRVGVICNSGVLNNFDTRFEVNVGHDIIRYPHQALEDFILQDLNEVPAAKD